MEMTYYEDGSPDRIEKYAYQYDENDRLIRYNCEGDGFSGEAAFSFNNEDVVVEMEWNDEYYGYSENTLNCDYENGRLVRIDQVPASTVYLYTYEDGNVSTAKSNYGTYYSPGESYTWEDGNVVKIVCYDGGPDGSYEDSLEYYDLENKSNLYLWEGFAYEPLGFSGFADMSVFPGMFGRRLLKTFSRYENTPYATVYTFRYEFDEEGYVTEYIVHQDNELYFKAVLNY
jgi:hypothetical protein